MSNSSTSETLKDLQILDEIERDENVSQRDLSGRIGLALGHTNQVLKRLIKKGLVKTSRINAKRVAYYLTPQGFSEKIRLVMKYAEYTVSFFAAVREGVSARLKELVALHGVRTVILVGTGELAEAAYLSAQELGLDIVGIFSEETSQKHWFGIEVRAPAEEGNPHADVIIITHMVGEANLLSEFEASGTHVIHIHELLSDSINSFANRIESEER